jgi:hypothetical protein
MGQSPSAAGDAKLAKPKAARAATIETNRALLLIRVSSVVSRHGDVPGRGAELPPLVEFFTVDPPTRRAGKA